MSWRPFNWTENPTFERHVPALTVATLVLTLGSVVVATTLSPTFRWEEHALSHLGVTDAGIGTSTTVWLFNGGLILGGGAGALFAALLARRCTVGGDRRVLASLTLTFVLLALVGVFPTGRPLHVPVAAAFFAFVTVTTWTDAHGQWLIGNRRWSLGSTLAGGTNVLIWLGWFGFAPNPRALAIPELLAALVFAAWLVGFATRLSASDSE